MTTIFIINIVATLIIHILIVCLAKPLLNMALATMDNWVGSAFFIEALFDNSVSNYFSLEGICNAVFTFALAYLVLFFIVKLIQVYFSWSNGDPETSPMTVLLGFMKALIVMLSFGTMYEYFVQIIYSMYTTLLSAGFNGGITADIINFNFSFSLYGAIIVFIVALEIFILYIGILARGIQILLLRIGIVFASIGLLNADGGAFKGYIKKFISNAFTILVQVFLCQLSVVLLSGGNYILALLTASTALKGVEMLSEFMQKTGYIGEQGMTSVVSQVSSIAHHAGGGMRALHGLAQKPATSVVSAGASGGKNLGGAINKGGKTLEKSSNAKISELGGKMRGFGARAYKSSSKAKGTAVNYKNSLRAGKSNIDVSASGNNKKEK